MTVSAPQALSPRSRPSLWNKSQAQKLSPTLCSVDQMFIEHLSRSNQCIYFDLLRY